MVFLLQGCLGINLLECEKRLELCLAQSKYKRVLIISIKNIVTGVRGLG